MNYSKPTQKQESIFKSTLDCCFTVHTKLGPGLLESAYEKCLAHELSKKGHQVKLQLPMPLVYDEIHLDAGYRIDIFVDQEVIVELKSVDALAPIHLALVLTYMKLAEVKLGLLINFNVKHLKDGIKRVIL